MGHVDRNREIIISNSTPEPRRESGFIALTRTFSWTTRTRTSTISEIPAARYISMCNKGFGSGQARLD